ncbi:hypothetical protein [Streptomyces tanashiensis]|uniref:hypothetical protein n=1 Tax=Streptomyces tanashiensis TaxID=67367 RepID=UPI0033D2DE95
MRSRSWTTEDADRAVAVRIAEEYLGPGGGKEYLEAPPEEVRVVVRITPTKILGNATRTAWILSGESWAANPTVT